MAGPAWIPGVERLGPGSGGAMEGGRACAVAHTVESPDTSAYFNSMAAYLKREAVWPQILCSPKTGRVGQFCPLNESGRALRNDGSIRTNRRGVVVIQIEFLGYAKNPFTNGWDANDKPLIQAMFDAIRAWTVPDVWPMGNPPAYPNGSSSRSRDIFYSRAGWYGHSQVPGNDHGDPGAIDTSKVPWRRTGGGGGSTPPPSGNGVTYTVVRGDTLSGIGTKLHVAWPDIAKANGIVSPYTIGIGQKLRIPIPGFPGAQYFGPGKNNSWITLLGTMLFDKGYGRFYREGPGPEWGSADQNAVAQFQRDQGWSGSDADGIPGQQTWQRLSA